MFRSRRSALHLPETAKVAEVVQAYYDAGRRPASHLRPSPEPNTVEVPDEVPAASPEPVPVVIGQLATAQAATAHAASVDPPHHSLPVHKTLAELAEELEAFIEVIRYGDDLGGGSARN